MIGIVHGKVARVGNSERGSWYIVAEDAKKKDGTPYAKRYMCSGREAPAEGDRIVVQGFAYAKVDERDGNHYANVNLSVCSFTVLEAGENATAGGEYPHIGDEDIPFHHLPRERYGVTRNGHMRW